MNPETKNCQNCKKDFTIESEDFQFYGKIKVPPPTFCAECRLQRRLSWRNMRSLYRRPCDLCKKEVIGMYAPDKPFKVYCTKCWWGDGWDGLEYGRAYDPGRPFFEQLKDLMQEVPRVNRFVYEDTMVNSDYTNMANSLKNCYLVFNSGGKFTACESCIYGEALTSATDCVDAAYLLQSQLCNRSVNLQHSYRVFYSKDCESCRDSYFLDNCANCENCFGCVNLRNKKYHIFNEAYSKEGYFEKLKELGFTPGFYKGLLELQKRSEELRVKAPHRYMHGVHNVNSSGDYVFDSKDTRHGFHVDGAENTKFCAYIIPPLKDSYDFTQYGDGAELTYEMLQSGEGVYNNHFGWCIWRQTKNSEYCMLQNGSSDCFGSIGLKNKRFCILNKQYSEDEYKTLRLKIIDDMNARPFIDRQKKEYRYGEFFPQDLCPFAYNETTAQEFFPLTKEEAVSKGYVWADKEKFKRKYTQTISASDLPDSIEETPDSILKEIIGCADCGAVYQIIPKELDFYRSNKLPLPRTCLECRYIERIMMRNPPRLWRRICQCAGIHSLNNVYQNTVAHTHGDAPCKTEFETSYAPDRPEIVYCEQCYQQEVV